jgi:hypothetical protein
MTKFIKLVALFILLIVVITLLSNWYYSFVSGSYWVHGSLGATLALGSAPIWILIVGVWLGKKILKFDSNSSKLFSFVLLVGLFSSLQSCRDYAKTNQIVVISNDCGATWEQIKSGESVPLGTTNRCFMKEVMPGYNMQGNLDYVVLFKGQVKVKMKATYDYEIFDPLLFMKEAKQLGKVNSDVDGAQDDNARFEGAENRVIDVRVKKVTSDQFQNEDVVSHDINALEETYMELINKALASRGVRLTILELVPDFQPQTQLAIDAANADRIYESKGMKEYGRQVTLAKAGANQITIQNVYGSGKENEEAPEK